MSDRHRVFVSYHDGRDQPGGGDREYRDKFIKLFHDEAEVLVSESVKDGDIDPTLNEDRIRQLIREGYLSDTTVTVVLVGAKTWQRRHVDWEIGASLRHTEPNPRSGLVGILLPTYPNYPKYNPRTIPPRLHDNVECEYANLYKWTEDPLLIKGIVHEAFLRRKTHQPNNTRKPFVYNRTNEQWSD